MQNRIIHLFWAGAFGTYDPSYRCVSIHHFWVSGWVFSCKILSTLFLAKILPPPCCRSAGNKGVFSLFPSGVPLRSVGNKGVFSLTGGIFARDRIDPSWSPVWNISIRSYLAPRGAPRGSNLASCLRRLFQDFRSEISYSRIWRQTPSPPRGGYLAAQGNVFQEFPWNKGYDSYVFIIREAYPDIRIIRKCGKIFRIIRIIGWNQ